MGDKRRAGVAPKPGVAPVDGRRSGFDAPLRRQVLGRLQSLPKSLISRSYSRQLGEMCTGEVAQHRVPVARGAQPDKAAIRRVRSPSNQPRRHGPIDQLDHAVMAKK